MCLLLFHISVSICCAELSRFTRRDGGGPAAGQALKLYLGIAVSFPIYPYLYDAG